MMRPTHAFLSGCLTAISVLAGQSFEVATIKLTAPIVPGAATRRKNRVEVGVNTLTMRNVGLANAVIRAWNAEDLGGFSFADHAVVNNLFW